MTPGRCPSPSRSNGASSFPTTHPLPGLPTWPQLFPDGASPGPRYSHAAIYDPVRDRMIVFGGFNASTFQDDNQVWSLSLSGTPTWTQLHPEGPAPSPRERHTAI